MITAVLFDLFETLVTESVVPPSRAGSLGEALGLDPVAFRAEWKARRPPSSEASSLFEMP